MADATPYPRPDPHRPNLRWQSLNGPWSFLFDDDDVGLTQTWHKTGLPASVALSAPAAAAQTKSATAAEGDSITQRIAAGTQDLLANNVFARADAQTHDKRTITVPFAFQTPASGINDRGVHEVLWYERAVADPRTAADRAAGQRVLLRFGAVDYEATVWIDGHLVGGHRGGHVPFELDVSDALREGGPRRLTVRVFDSAYDLTQPRGKQYWGPKPESIFYTPSGGIWQSVWVEVVPPARIADSSAGTVIRSTDIETGTLRSNVAVLGRRVGQALEVEIEASLAGVPVATSERKALSKESNAVAVELDLRLSEEKRKQLPPAFLVGAPFEDDSAWREGLALWSPEHPSLYDLTLRLYDSAGAVLDEVATTTGMRSIAWAQNDGHWRLNGRPYFQALCLDQGYWPETLMTPPSQESLKEDILLAKRMGLNGCRKHQKVEDPVFYYWADRLGYLVWGEMANAYQFSAAYMERFDEEWAASVRLAVNHPSVVTWTPVNESWGYPSLKDSIEQRNHIRSLYYLTKTLDPTRSINDNCGWEHVMTDLTTFHDYADGPQLAENCATMDKILDTKAGRDMFVPAVAGDAGSRHKQGAPVMCTEFGGVNIAAAKGKEGDDRDWGYTTAADSEDLLKRIERLVRGVVEGGHCCAFVYTQLADIEQETNGLYTFDRKDKLDAARVKALIEEALKAFYARVEGQYVSAQTMSSRMSSP
ncbi:hypothetical protein VD0003_g3239 [Verticillium dahliae]|nr:hypothetical protein VD0003_g3239 [Verticillium dahliae]